MPPRRSCPEGDGWRYCPDCGRCVPATDFARDYCKAHQYARSASSRARSLATSEAARAKKRAADKRYRERHKDERNAASRGWKQRNPLKVQAWYAAWVRRNPELRRRSQEAYRERRRLRAERYRFKVDAAPRPEYDPRDE